MSACAARWLSTLRCGLDAPIRARPDDKRHELIGVRWRAKTRLAELPFDCGVVRLAVLAYRVREKNDAGRKLVETVAASLVSADAIRDELKSRGLLERDEKTGSFTRAARTMLYKAKSALVSANAPLAEKDGLIWRK